MSVRSVSVLAHSTILSCCVALASLVSSCGPGGSRSEEQSKAAAAKSSSFKATTLAELTAERQEMDRTVWAPELVAEQHHGVFIQLWDELRATADPLTPLSKFRFEQILLPSLAETGRSPDGIATLSSVGAGKQLDHAAWETWLASLRGRYRLDHSEWQQTRFETGTDGNVAEVRIALLLTDTKTGTRLAVRGPLRVTYSREQDAFLNFQPRTIDATGLWVQRRAEPALFQEVFSFASEGGNDVPPILVHDRDGDGDAEIIVPASNLVFRNSGRAKFERTDLCAYPLTTTFEAVIADWNGDGRDDYLAAGLAEGDAVGSPALYLFASDAKGGFSAPPTRAFPQPFEGQCCFAAGDIDRDGDLDLYVGKYLPPYVGGQMPTPFWDANDGFPGQLLANDGTGTFTDVTVGSGLEAKRNRRTFRCSFADLDQDSDLDLLLTNDFHGIDVFTNDGHGHFTDQSSTMIDEPWNFGMSHSLADFNSDGEVDLYVTGMYSITVRRLEQLGLGVPGRPEVQAHRMQMGFGNRLYWHSVLGFRQPKTVETSAESGWSWGVSSLDYDLDGDPDIYVANGHIAGATVRDYDSRYWRHDIYSGNSTRNPLWNALYLEIMSGMTKEYSWNGFEYNRLFRNDGEDGFSEVGYVLGVGLPQESRQVVSEDFDLDGRPDLLVGEIDRAGNRKSIHLFRNTWSGRAHWLGVRLLPAARRSSLGAQITVVAGGRRQSAVVLAGDSFFSQHSNTKVFGLGETGRVDSVLVRWPDGERSAIAAPVTDRYHVVDAAH